MLPTALLITHPDAPLMRPCAFRIGHLTRTAAQACTLHAMLCRAWIKGVRSNERKARDGAEILTEGLGLSKYTVVTGLGENDRSATGYLNKATKRSSKQRSTPFFSQPHTSVRGGETAAAARARIVRAVEQVLSQAHEEQDVAMIGHGGTGTCCTAI